MNNLRTSAKNRNSRRYSSPLRKKPSSFLHLSLFIGGLFVIGAVLAANKPSADNSKNPSKELGQLFSQSLTIPEDTKPAEQSSKVTPDHEWNATIVKAGDSPSSIFSELNIHSQLHEVFATPIAKDTLSKIRPGDKISTKIINGKLHEMSFSPDEATQLQVSRIDGELTSKLIKHDIEFRRVINQGIINNSLYLDGKKSGLSDNLIMQLFNVFAYDIDFALDIRKGDSFKVIYDERYLSGEKLKDGRIIGAEFVNRGKTYRAFRYTTPQGDSDYYDNKGRSLKKAFIRTPIQFARVSSHFNLKRMHPVLHKIRAHKGVDYAASKGTPIRATGSGKIIFRGVKGGYGNVVIIKHDKRHTTLYAHMSKFRKGHKVGSRVKQGQVIGYVGASGRVTGAHLHYEFRVNGAHKNPLTVKLPKSQPLAKSQRGAFIKQTAPVVSLLDTETTLATYY